MPKQYMQKPATVHPALERHALPTSQLLLNVEAGVCVMRSTSDEDSWEIRVPDECAIAPAGIFQCGPPPRSPIRSAPALYPAMDFQLLIRCSAALHARA